MERDVRKIEFRLFNWNPGWHNLAPLVLWLVISVMLQFSRLAGPLAPSILQWLNPVVHLSFLVVPILFIRLVEKKSLAYVGLTRRRVGLAFAIGLPLGFMLGWFLLFRVLLAGRFPYLPPVYNAISYSLSALMGVFAVEFFYRGWLVANLERSFGFIPAVLVSALLYTFSFLVVLGTDPNVPAALSTLSYYWKEVFPVTFIIAVILAGIARLTRSLLTPILAMLPQTIVGDLLPGGAAHGIIRPEAKIVGTLALVGVVSLVAWLTRRGRRLADRLPAA